MRTINTENPILITNEQISEITELIESTFLLGVNIDQDKSLFINGFVYDSKYRFFIKTRPMHMWKTMKGQLTYDVGELDMTDIYRAMTLNRDAVLKMSGKSIEEWMGMSDAWKIKEMEEFNLTPSKCMVGKSMYHDKLVKKLKKFIETNYKFNE